MNIEEVLTRADVHSYTDFDDIADLVPVITKFKEHNITDLILDFLSMDIDNRTSFFLLNNYPNHNANLVTLDEIIDISYTTRLVLPLLHRMYLDLKLPSALFYIL